ncbi:hypothetical protein [Novacetimonas pomaceti]|uniref:hypothetical protein n=1 Tax=Novacetimonas pomaceti TaxID=2021998 RepID=UPI001C2CDF9D|nr:hypothetical protein [Novacetimonas pomaceti]MBV1833860.1 hypothetical protein [Novacetimonas pomaceti]
MPRAARVFRAGFSRRARHVPAFALCALQVGLCLSGRLVEGKIQSPDPQILKKFLVKLLSKKLHEDAAFLDKKAAPKNF